MNQDIHIGIVGAGRMGSAIYELLVSSSLYVADPIRPAPTIPICIS
jgi:pyrroline-5-carboxylate reductase